MPSQDDVAAFGAFYKQGCYNMVASNGQVSKEKTQKIPPKPTVLEVIPENIPPELKAIPNWVCWFYELRQSNQGEWKWTKPPLQVNSRYARSDQPRTWTTFERVLETISIPSGSSDSVQSSIPKQTAGELDQAQVVLPMLVVTDQDRPALRQPCQRPLHHPAPCLATPGKPLLPAVLTDRPDVADVPFLLGHLMPGGIVVPLVQAQVLLDLLGVGPLDDDRLDRRLQQLLIDDVRSGDHYPERATVAVGQHTLLGPRLASVGGVFPHLFPPPNRALPSIASAACHFQ